MVLTFTAAQAKSAVGKPVEIASRAYGGRMGNENATVDRAAFKARQRTNGVSTIGFDKVAKLRNRLLEMLD